MSGNTIAPGITTGPRQQEPHELLAQMRVELPPELRTIFDDVRAKQDQIRANTKFTDAAKQEMLSDVEQQARAQFDATYERVHAARQKELDREEGRVRRELLDPPPSHDIIAGDRERLDTVAKQVHRHAALAAESNALHMVSVAPDAEELLRVFDDAEARGIERVMAAATFRAEAFAKRERTKENALPLDSPAARIARDMRARLTAFRREHPSATERLKNIEARRQRITAELDRATNYARRVYKWSDARGPRIA